MNLMLYVSTVLIWGSTWIAIAWQLGPIPIEVSVLYRFALAALALFTLLTVSGKFRACPGRASVMQPCSARCSFHQLPLFLPRHPLYPERSVGGDFRQRQYLQRPQSLAVRG